QWSHGPRGGGPGIPEGVDGVADARVGVAPVQPGALDAAGPGHRKGRDEQDHVARVLDPGACQASPGDRAGPAMSLDGPSDRLVREVLEWFRHHALRPSMASSLV